MGQFEIYELLKELGKVEDRYFTKDEILVKINFAEKKISNTQLSRYLLQLDKHGYLDVNFNWSGKFCDWKKEVRLKRKYIGIEL